MKKPNYTPEIRERAVQLLIEMAQQPLQISTPLNTVELNTIFDESQLQNLQATELSNQEMKDTQGAVLPLYALGVFAMGTERWIRKFEQLL